MGTKFSLIVSFLSTILSLAGGLYGTRDLITPKSELNLDSAIIKSYRISYQSGRRSDIPQLDIILRDKPYFIRLNEESQDYWLQIRDEKNLNKKIRYRYLDHLLRKYILYNPNELEIENEIIIPFGSDSKRLKMLISLMFFSAILFGFLFYMALKEYKKQIRRTP